MRVGAFVLFCPPLVSERGCRTSLFETEPLRGCVHCAGVCTQAGKGVGGWCPEKDDCQQFPSPCLDIDQGWYMGNATHMPTKKPFFPDSNQHEGYCSGDWSAE